MARAHNSINSEINKQFKAIELAEFEPASNPLPFPSNPAVLSIQGRTITTDIPKQIRRLHRGKILRDFTIEKEQRDDPSWSASTWNSIDFNARYIALKRESPSMQHRLLKLQNRWLPVGTRQFDKVTTPHIISCPSCCETETHRHLFTCTSSNSRDNYRLQLTLLRRFLRPTKILAVVWEVLSQELAHAMGFGDPPSYHLPDDRTGILLECALTDQRKIGWLNVFKGWLSPNWGQSMQPYYSQRFPDQDQYSALTFQIRLTRGLWRFFHGIWEQRRCLVHDAENASKTRDLDSQIQQLYRRRNHLVSYEDRALFKTFTLDECLNLSAPLKSTWIEYIHQAIKLHHGSLKPLTAPLNTVTNYFDRQQRRRRTINDAHPRNSQEG